ncbi:hypothetical protein [Chondromyces apiculatus]|uniref:Uncharacterized protein n=1 Tax=Chondromyces apiculatus DSM 436 TaxID=1192034 RepID=A0A017T1K3_9BACT|nr:hypothetical protein [Chondromyces apiculatus]EYF03129.1 Hypothetical protein CAP_6105 [Chondromyces apiculatus DSM 436]
MHLLISSWRSGYRGRLALLALPALIAAAVGVGACSASSDGSTGTFGDGGSGASSSNGTGNNGEGGAGGDLFGNTTVTTTGGSTDDCSEAAKLIYIIGAGNNLYSFHPPTLAVTPIGVINCPQTGGATPFSMAVDRQGTAWILFNDGRLYNVDTQNAVCTATSFQPGQQGLTRFGMGYVSDAPGSSDEKLYIADFNGSGIATIDTTSLTVTPVRPYDALFQAAELTGTGDARLFGFFTGSPVQIAEIEPATGHVLSMAPQPSISIGNGWAFAFWGGDFYTFTNPSGSGSQIDRYSPSMAMTSTVLTGIGDNIVGAGVSTCAPTQPPQ